MRVSADLADFYDIVIQVCIAKYGFEPDEVHIESDGQISVINITELYSDPDIREIYYLAEEDFSKDFTVMISERKKKEEEKRIKEQEEKRIRVKQEDERQKKNRHDMYLKLKSEFE